MRLSRRGLLRAGLAGTAATALGGLASGCAVPTGSTGRNMVLWYWSGGLSDTVVKKAKARYDSSVDLDAIQIGGYYRSKLITTMTGQAHIPDIAGLKGEDMASYLPNADQFIDLRTLGAEKLKSQYLDWKWQQAVAPDGSLIGFPIDVGPVVQYYQPAVYEKAGLASEPDDVSSEMNTWDKFFAAGEQLKKRIPGTYILTDVGSVFEMSIGQGTTRYVNQDKHFIGDGEHVRVCWDRAVEAKRRGIVSDLVTGTPDSISATEKGKLPSQLNASWAAGDLKLQYPKTKGRWRVANCPGGPSNVGGSFLAITKACREPEKAFEIITWLLNADNQAHGFVDAGLFPSTPASYDMKELREPTRSSADQVTIGRLRPGRGEDPGRLQQPVRRGARAADQGRDQERRRPRQGPQEGLEGRHEQVPAHRGPPGGELTDGYRPLVEKPPAPAVRATHPQPQEEHAELLAAVRRDLALLSVVPRLRSVPGRLLAVSVVPPLGRSRDRWSAPGSRQYKYLLTDTDFWSSIGNTIIIWALATFPMIFLAMVTAVMLNSAVRFKKIYRFAYFLPNVTSVVAVAIIFGSVFSTNFGLVNALLQAVGLDQVAWLNTPWGIKVAIAALMTWQWTGYNAIIFLAGLQTIPGELYEAARVDGAGPIQTFFRITLPMMRPVLLFVLVISTVTGLQSFSEPQVLLQTTANESTFSGGPDHAGRTMVLYFFQQTFDNNDFGYGAAVAWGIFLVVVIFSIINWRLVQRRGED